MNWFVKKREETKIEIKYLCYINPNAIYKVIRSQDNTGEWLLKKMKQLINCVNISWKNGIFLYAKARWLIMFSCILLGIYLFKNPL